MSKSLIFIPDISGFTNFVNTTEVEHSQHVIAELLEVIISSNTYDLRLAEVEGDALFFYKENEVLSVEQLLAQVETTFTAFYSHLKLMETNRICPCNACASAPKLELKIIIHSGELQFIKVQENRKPFGQQVIEAHRLMKNSVASNNYVLLSKALTEDIKLSKKYQSKIYHFKPGSDEYDGKELEYVYSTISQKELTLKPFQSKKIKFACSPPLSAQKEFPIPAINLLEYITNYKYRYQWVDGVDKFEYNESEVTRIGTEHVCVINEKHLNFVTVTKEAQPGQLVYGELTTDLPIVDELHQFYIIEPLTEESCKLNIEIYWKNKTPIKKLIVPILLKRFLRSNMLNAMDKLFEFSTANTTSKELEEL